MVNSSHHFSGYEDGAGMTEEGPVFFISAPMPWSGHVESYLEDLDIPYLRQGQRGAALALELGLANEIFDYYIPASAYQLAAEGLDELRELLGV